MDIDYQEISAAYTAKMQELVIKWRNEKNPADTNILYGQMLGLVVAAELLPVEPNPLRDRLKEVIKSAQWDY